MYHAIQKSSHASVALKVFEKRKEDNIKIQEENEDEIWKTNKKKEYKERNPENEKSLNRKARGVVRIIIYN